MGLLWVFVFVFFHIMCFFFFFSPKKCFPPSRTPLFPCHDFIHFSIYKCGYYWWILFHLYTFYNLLLLRVCRLQYFKRNTYTWKAIKNLLKIKWNFVMVFKTNCKMFSTYSLTFSLGFFLKPLGVWGWWVCERGQYSKNIATH